MNTAGQIANKALRSGFSIPPGSPNSGDLVNEVFEYFRLAYPFWCHGLSEADVGYKKRQWHGCITGRSPEVVRQAMTDAVRTIERQSGPTLADFRALMTHVPAHKLVPEERRIDYRADPAVAREAIETMKGVLR